MDSEAATTVHTDSTPTVSMELTNMATCALSTAGCGTYHCTFWVGPPSSPVPWKKAVGNQKWSLHYSPSFPLLEKFNMCNYYNLMWGVSTQIWMGRRHHSCFPQVHTLMHGHSHTVEHVYIVGIFYMSAYINNSNLTGSSLNQKEHQLWDQYHWPWVWGCTWWRRVWDRL